VKAFGPFSYRKGSKVKYLSSPWFPQTVSHSLLLVTDGEGGRQFRLYQNLPIIIIVSSSFITQDAAHTCRNTHT